jgi:hypothetical protein
MKTVTLEPSTNTHELHSADVQVSDFGQGILILDIPSTEGIVTHGEHGTLKTESKHVIKYVQQEFNPVTQMMQNAFD